MSTPATAFAPGSPAGGLPSFQSSSSAKSGDASLVQGGIDHSGFTVNYGSGVLQGGAMSPWIVGAVLLGLLLWKKRST